MPQFLSLYESRRQPQGHIHARQTTQIQRLPPAPAVPQPSPDFVQLDPALRPLRLRCGRPDRATTRRTVIPPPHIDNRVFDLSTNRNYVTKNQVIVLFASACVQGIS